MSTIYTFHQECAALGAVPAADDELLIYDASAARVKNVTAAFLGAAAPTVTTGTTLSNMSNNGITLAQSSAAVYTLTAPTLSGVEKTILFPASTGTRTVTPSGAAVLGSTISPSGATVITVTGTSDIVSASITLVSQGTTNWYIVGRSGPAVTS